MTRAARVLGWVAAAVILLTCVACGVVVWAVSSVPTLEEQQAAEAAAVERLDARVNEFARRLAQTNVTDDDASRLTQAAELTLVQTVRVPTTVTVHIIGH